jgi:hypothetical protein
MEETHRNTGTVLCQTGCTCLVYPDALLPAVDTEFPKDRWSDRFGSAGCAKAFPHLPAMETFLFAYVYCHGFSVRCGLNSI